MPPPLPQPLPAPSSRLLLPLVAAGTVVLSLAAVGTVWLVQRGPAIPTPGPGGGPKALGKAFGPVTPGPAESPERRAKRLMVDERFHRAMHLALRKIHGDLELELTRGATPEGGRALAEWSDQWKKELNLSEEKLASAKSLMPNPYALLDDKLTASLDRSGRVASREAEEWGERTSSGYRRRVQAGEDATGFLRSMLKSTRMAVRHEYAKYANDLTDGLLDN